MKVDNIFLLYCNSDKYFPTYDQAYFNSKKAGMNKQVYYIFTPTMQRFKRVCEIEKCCRDYFKKHTDCEFFDIINKTGNSQLKIIEEI